jgi:hypothetical protein
MNWNTINGPSDDATAMNFVNDVTATFMANGNDFLGRLRTPRHYSTYLFITMASSHSPLLDALAAHKVSATVVDLDHYRIQGGLAIETDYIISVEPTEKVGDDTETFESFRYGIAGYRGYFRLLPPVSYRFHLLLSYIESARRIAPFVPCPVS